MRGKKGGGTVFRRKTTHYERKSYKRRGIEYMIQKKGTSGYGGREGEIYIQKDIACMIQEKGSSGYGGNTYSEG
jgi:hypothetical protein